MACNEINKAVAHKPFRSGSEDYMAFIEKTFQKIRQLESAFPEMGFSKEKQQLQFKRPASPQAF